MLASDAPLLAPEGPLPVGKLVGKTVPVLGRGPNGRLRFHLVGEIRLVAESAPVWKVALENGRFFRAGSEQVVFDPEEKPVRLSDVRPGADLFPAYAYPRGYRYRTDEGEEKISTGGIRVVEIGPDGSAPVYAVRLRTGDRFFLDCGILCAAEPPSGGHEE